MVKLASWLDMARIRYQIGHNTIQGKFSSLDPLRIFPVWAWTNDRHGHLHPRQHTGQVLNCEPFCVCPSHSLC